MTTGDPRDGGDERPIAEERPAVATGGVRAWRLAGRPRVSREGPTGASGATDATAFQPPDPAATRAEYEPVSDLAKDLVDADRTRCGIEGGEAPWMVVCAGVLLIALGMTNVISGFVSASILLEPVTSSGAVSGGASLARNIGILVLLDCLVSVILGHVLGIAGVTAFSPPWRFESSPLGPLARLATWAMLTKAAVVTILYLAWIRPAQAALPPGSVLSAAVKQVPPALFPWLTLALAPAFGLVLWCLGRPSARAWFARQRS